MLFRRWHTAQIMAPCGGGGGVGLRGNDTWSDQVYGLGLDLQAGQSAKTRASAQTREHLRYNPCSKTYQWANCSAKVPTDT